MSVYGVESLVVRAVEGYNRRMHQFSVAASVMAMNQSALGDEIRATDAAGIDMFHWDIMDGHFVPNMTFGSAALRDLRAVTNKPFDTHLMVSDPARWIADFAKAGSNAITFHAELNTDIITLAETIRSHSVKAGLAFNPDTALDSVNDSVFAHIDRILIMTVQPGFGGQAFIDQSAKIRQAVAIKQRHPHLDISVDGGINLQTGLLAIEAGADILVSGSALNKAESQQDFITTLKAIATEMRA